MYAFVSFFGVATVGGLGAGQTHPVYGAATAITKEGTKSNARLLGAGVVRYWFNNARSDRTPQGYAGVAG